MLSGLVQGDMALASDMQTLGRAMLVMRVFQLLFPALGHQKISRYSQESVSVGPQQPPFLLDLDYRR
jgi:hypothetical protein